VSMGLSTKLATPRYQCYTHTFVRKYAVHGVMFIWAINLTFLVRSHMKPHRHARCRANAPFVSCDVLSLSSVRLVVCVKRCWLRRRIVWHRIGQNRATNCSSSTQRPFHTVKIKSSCVSQGLYFEAVCFVLH
jgi:hypothetical protein